MANDSLRNFWEFGANGLLGVIGVNGAIYEMSEQSTPSELKDVPNFQNGAFSLSPLLGAGSPFVIFVAILRIPRDIFRNLLSPASSSSWARRAGCPAVRGTFFFSFRTAPEINHRPHTDRHTHRTQTGRWPVEQPLAIESEHKTDFLVFLRAPLGNYFFYPSASNYLKSKSGFDHMILWRGKKTSESLPQDLCVACSIPTRRPHNCLFVWNWIFI